MKETRAVRVAVLVSGSGTNLQALLDAYDRGELSVVDFVLVASNNPSAYALERAKQHGIPTAVCPVRETLERDLRAVLEASQVEVVVLAGFLVIFSADFVNTYHGRIINIHPSLIPSFCGKGFYGLWVHREVLQYGVKVTGATAHLVNEIPDGGKILCQKAVEVLEDDTPESLQRRVMEEAEWILLPKALQMVCERMVKS